MERARLLRPLGYRDLFDETFDLLKRNFAVLFGIVAVGVVPLYLLSEQLALLAGPGAVVTGIESLVLILAGFLASAALTTAIADSYLGKPISIAGAYRAIFGHFVPFAVTMLLATAIAMLGLLGCGIGLVYTLLSVMFVTPVYIVEDTRYMEAVRRSWSLASGQRLRIFVLTLLAGLVAGVAQLIVAGIWGAASVALGLDLEHPTRVTAVGNGLTYGIVATLGSVLQAIPLILLYFDVRVRREGFDIELLAQSLGESTPSTPA